MDLALHLGTGSAAFAPAVLGACAARSAADGIADVGGFGWYPYALDGLFVFLCVEGDCDLFALRAGREGRHQCHAGDRRYRPRGALGH